MRDEKKNGWNLACIDQSEQNRWLGKLAESNWFFHIKEALTTACIIAQTIDREGRIISSSITRKTRLKSF